MGERMSKDRRWGHDRGPTRTVTRAQLVLAVTVLLCLLGAGAASAAYPGADGRVAFVRAHSIYTIADSGMSLRRLTSGRDCSGPRWSPNGQRIAYLCGGDLWVMTASGSHKTRLTGGAPNYRDSRPSWSPNGRYLAFVKTQSGHRYGYLTRYDTVTHRQVTFSTPYNSESPTRRQVKVTALPDAVAWSRALTGSSYGSFILVEGAGSSEFCQPGDYCLDALGAPRQSQYRNEFPSSEDSTAAPKRLLDPDWFPNSPQFGTDALTTQDSCTNSGCTPKGIDLRVGASPTRPGAYQAVYSPTGGQIAYVLNTRGVPTIYTASTNPATSDVGTVLTAGTEPDWQPLPETARAAGDSMALSMR
jgi:Dipeptidyl peptidase IV (DPP IV) N-terminal region